MTDDRQDPLVRRGALLLSYLALTPDKGLEIFARRKAAHGGISASQVAKMRCILDALGFVLASTEGGGWLRVEQAWAILKDVPRPEVDGLGVAGSSKGVAVGRSAGMAQQRDDRVDVVEDGADSGAVRGPIAADNAISMKEHVKASAGPARADTCAKAGGDMTETASIEQVAVQRAATPFRDGAEGMARPRVALGEAHEGSGVTAVVDPAVVAAVIAGLPSVSASSLPMELNDYASLVAHTELGGPMATGAPRVERHAQYDIEDDAQRVAIDVTFSDYFRDNPEVFEKYLALLERWRTWLRS